MAKKLVIVESPAKAKTIKKYLGSGYQVAASAGHVRDLPKSSMGVDLENDFEPHYITIRGKGELIAELKREVKKASFVYLATDPDREGEAISWHLMSTLELDPARTARITFNEITESAIKNSLAGARDILQPLVDAQQARRVLDRVAGYQMSPVLWKKVKKGLSAGRVQSAALKLICDREEAIDDFVPEEFWTVEAALSLSAKQKLTAHLSEQEGAKPSVTTAGQAEKIKSELEKAGSAQVEQLRRGRRSRKAPDAFITSTLQQEAANQLGLSPINTMRIAQQLYEGIDLPGRGRVALISYLRTDSVRVSAEAAEMAKAYILEHFGEEYLGEAPAEEASSSALVQDAHEAIRPTNAAFTPESVKEALDDKQFKLYRLIWNRFLASRMAPAEYETYSVDLSCGGYGLNSSGSRMVFPGFSAVYREEKDEEIFQDISSLAIGSRLPIDSVAADQHFTAAPPHFTEASLVKAMQELGLGRPSTYAPTVYTLLERDYVVKEKKSLMATELGSVVNRIINQYFEQVADLSFTASMEEQLDEVAEGKLDWKQVVRDFYRDFGPSVDRAMQELEKVKLEDPVTDIICEKCGRNMVIKMGKYGKFFACPGFPECRNSITYYEETGLSCPKCGKPVLLRRSHSNRIFYNCAGQPDCDFLSWDLPTEEKCPQCGERLYQKSGRRPALYCQKEGCGYRRETNE